jgi:hypothetical protein
MSLATIATTSITSAGTKQFNEYPIYFAGYQVKDDTLTNKLYTEGSSAYSATAVATGTTTIQTSRKPLAGDLYNTVFNPADTSVNVPLVAKGKDYTRITGTSINDGAKWTVSWDLSADNIFTIVLKSAGTSVAGKLKIRSSASNESVCAFTTSSTANTWERKSFDFKTNGATGVTFTGTPVFTAITEIEVTLDAITTSVDVAMIYGAGNTLQLIGNRLDYAHPCISEMAFENALEKADLLCGQQVVESTGTSRAISVKIGAKKKDIEAEAIAMGNVIKYKSGYFLELINDTNVGNKAVTAGAITLASGLNIARVYIEGVGNLKKADSATSITEGGYFYTGTTLTISTIHNGKVPTIYIFNLKSVLTTQIKDLELGYVGWLQIPRKLLNGKYQYVTCKKAQVMLEPETMAEDYDQMNFMYNIYPSGGTYAEIATEV